MTLLYNGNNVGSSNPFYCAANISLIIIFQAPNALVNGGAFCRPMEATLLWLECISPTCYNGNGRC
jgi:hypothetical protein